MNKPKINTHLPPDVVLRVDNLSKKFCRTLKRSMYYGTLDIARSMLGLRCNSEKLRKDEFWALDDVTFELRKGETLGIIGVNGSGKSTLLRLITGILPPDKGKISFKGRIGALIAVGAGFHPHMTGRENIYLNGTILGMTRKEIDRKLNDIIDFADIGDFLEAPVNTYSSGMRVRLGFSIAVHCEPDILLIDEVLSVGDLTFRNKSLKKMSEMRQNNEMSIIFISHNMDQIQNLCDRGIILSEGKNVFSGQIEEVVLEYYNITREKVDKNFDNEQVFNVSRSSGDIEIIKILLIDEMKNEIERIDIEDNINLSIQFSVNSEILGEIEVNIGIVNEMGNNIIWLKSHERNAIFKNLTAGEYNINISILKPNLMPGLYRYAVGFKNRNTLEDYIKANKRNSFRIDGSIIPRGVVFCDSLWEMKKIN